MQKQKQSIWQVIDSVKKGSNLTPDKRKQLRWYKVSSKRKTLTVGSKNEEIWKRAYNITDSGSDKDGGVYLGSVLW